MKSANSSGKKAGMKRIAMRQEVARISADLSFISKEVESAGAEASGSPEQNATESMENGCVSSVLAVTSILMPRTRTHHIRAKTTREAVLRKEGNDPAENIPGKNAADFSNTPDIYDIPNVMNKRFNTQRKQASKVLQQKSRTRRQFLTQKASAR